MGLDMEIMRVSKPHMDESVIYNSGELDGIIIPEYDWDSPLCKDLLPYVQTVQVRTQEWDWDAMRRDNGVSSNAHVAHIGNDVTFCDKDKTVHIPMSVIEEKYTLELIEPYYVSNCETIKSWRGDYRILDWFHANIERSVENTGYYILSGELLSKFNEAFRDHEIEVEEPDDESALFYWEWY